ncbi:hypothetical protein CAEBREN_00203 [Caenorhabditis brenneri]|uniref:Uncharacterized protein n=1 Tax=Caenorhabditis brenneri TaxID=135651 RepID=G0MYE0_CAEBE|nr:hypothetical protein CAEBREN_00203 [Caenorhabditis brenneri]
MEFQQNQWTRACLKGIANEEPILHLGTKLGKHWNNKDMHVAIQIADVFNPIRTEEIQFETQMLYQPIVCICEVYEDPFEQEVLSQPIEFTFDCLKFIAVPSLRNPVFEIFRLNHLKASPPRSQEGKVILGHKQLYDNNGANNAVTSDYNPNKVYEMDKDMDEWVSCYKAQANDVYHPSVTFALWNDH